MSIRFGERIFKGGRIGLNSNPTSGESDFDDSERLLLNVKDDALSNNGEAYSAITQGVTDGAGGEKILAEGVDSLFNPFYSFRYAKYSNAAGANIPYFNEYHFDQLTVKNQNTMDAIQAINKDKETSQNPSATKIIEWAKASVGKNNQNTISATPYTLNDFLWCKWYGKIPNNRLVTLRRFPIPVEDNLQVAAEKAPLIPLAQAVTWWGEETNNKLNNILGFSYGLKWVEKLAEVKDVSGNEILASDILTAFGLGDTKNQNLIRQFLLTTGFANEGNLSAFSGQDVLLQQYAKDAWGSAGPYWNQVLGPVNVINSTAIRDRGFDFNGPITLNFTYSLRSFNNINPKVAMLDLITNFLTLTYNTAEFWGGQSRYFPRTGVTAANLPQDKFANLDYVGGIKDLFSYLTQTTGEKAEDLSKFFKSLLDQTKDATLINQIDQAVSKVEGTPTAKALAGSWVKNLIQGPLLFRSILDGRAVGEWHVTVGNPMDPIAVIGNLYLKKTEMSFSDSLGLDDFPTEINFKLTLDHGRPRAKQDIESMFNLGGGPFSYGKIPITSSEYNTFDEKNGAKQNRLREQGAVSTSSKSQAQTSNQADASTETGSLFTQSSIKAAENIASYYRPRIKNMYGDGFSQSGALVDYFIDLKTKD